MADGNIKVSVIVPVYNEEEWICRCLASLVHQTLKEIEIILVDDGSTDSTPEICDGYAKLYNNIKVVHKQNKGLGFARNSGLEVACGEYVTFCDSDDYVDLETYERAYEKAKLFDAEVVRFDYTRETPDGQTVLAHKRCPLKEGFYGEDKIKEEIFMPTFGMLPYQGAKDFVDCSSCTNIYKREFVEKHGFKFVSERECISEDLMFCLEVFFKAQSVYVLTDKFYHYIVNKGSLTTKYRKDKLQESIKLYEDLVAKSKKFGVYESVRLRTKRTFISLFRGCIKQELVLNKDKKQANKNIIDIIENEMVWSALNAFPIKQMKLKYRLTYFAINHKNLFLLRLIKNKI